MNLTRREKIASFIIAGFFVLFLLFPGMSDSKYEMVYMLFVVLPVGALIATDKERISKK